MSLMSRLKAMNVDLDSLETLFVEGLKDLYNVESQVIGALPEMVNAATSPQLKNALQEHIETSKRQKSRIEQIFHQLGKEPEQSKSEGISGIIEEGQILAHARGRPEVRDAALIGAAQHVQHYEMASYGTCRTFAERLGRPEIANLLQQTLDEEKLADKGLTDLAENEVNPQALQKSPFPLDSTEGTDWM
jgi:ferritin-like metal-binding protein YciE